MKLFIMLVFVVTLVTIVLDDVAAGEQPEKKEAKFCNNCVARPLPYLVGKRANMNEYMVVADTAPNTSGGHRMIVQPIVAWEEAARSPKQSTPLRQNRILPARSSIDVDDADAMELREFLLRL